MRLSIANNRLSLRGESLKNNVSTMRPRLRDFIVDNSQGDTLQEAVTEWEITRVWYSQSHCICGHHIMENIEIQNTLTLVRGVIGNDCINYFHEGFGWLYKLVRNIDKAHSNNKVLVVSSELLLTLHKSEVINGFEFIVIFNMFEDYICFDRNKNKNTTIPDASTGVFENEKERNQRRVLKYINTNIAYRIRTETSDMYTNVTLDGVDLKKMTYICNKISVCPIVINVPKKPDLPYWVINTINSDTIEITKEEAELLIICDLCTKVIYY